MVKVALVGVGPMEMVEELYYRIPAMWQKRMGHILMWDAPQAVQLGNRFWASFEYL